MKTIVDLDDRLLGEALRLTGARTKRQVINLSLEELVRRRRLDGLKAKLGRTKIDLTLARLERMRRGR